MLQKTYKINQKSTNNTSGVIKGNDSYIQPQYNNLAIRSSYTVNNQFFSPREGKDSKKENSNIVIGISRLEMDKHVSIQGKTKWCWVNCVNVISSFYGIKVTQSEIVNIADSRFTKTGILKYISGYTEPLNHGNGNEHSDIAYTIKKIFEKYNYTIDVKRHEFTNIPNSIKIILKELKKNRPLILSYSKHNGGRHAIILTGIVVDSTETKIHKLFTRTSSTRSFENGNKGKKIYENNSLEDILGRIIALTTINPTKK